jgi:hypothetical protein
MMKVQLIQPGEWLLEKINVKKKSLMEIASTMELRDERVVNCSQELDRLLNLLQRQKLHLLDHASTINKNQGKKGDIRWGY